MKAIIMAAGKGTRISRFIPEKPKCTLDIGGISLIEYTVGLLNKKGINDIAIIVGYKGEIIREILKKNCIRFYYNYFYDITNSIVSLWFAKDFICDDDFFFINGDVFIEDEILDLIINEKCSPVIFSDETRKETADYKLFYKDEKLIKYGKDLTGEDITGEYIGIGKVKREDLKLFINRLEHLINNQRHNLWWEDILYSLSGEMNIYVRDISKAFWGEIDCFQDYEKIIEYRIGKKHINNHNEAVFTNVF